ncbi:MAG: hypothetical protein N3D10_00565 [Candidatus Micrarchaeota archaeon]|nr:hypothetical protein [Candidatus Micrarchaeota archaeon]
MEKELEKNYRFVIVDTNFWLLFYERAINIIEGIENLFSYKPFLILVPTSILAELKIFSSKKNKRAVAAKSCLLLINKLKEEKKLKIVPTKDKNADSFIITLARKVRAYVATSDKKLISKLRKYKIKIITLKDKHLISFL